MQKVRKKADEKDQRKKEKEQRRGWLMIVFFCIFAWDFLLLIFVWPCMSRNIRDMVRSLLVPWIDWQHKLVISSMTWLRNFGRRLRNYCMINNISRVCPFPWYWPLLNYSTFHWNSFSLSSFSPIGKQCTLVKSKRTLGSNNNLWMPSGGSGFLFPFFTRWNVSPNELSATPKTTISTRYDGMRQRGRMITTEWTVRCQGSSCYLSNFHFLI